MYRRSKEEIDSVEESRVIEELFSFFLQSAIGGLNEKYIFIELVSVWTRFVRILP